MPVDFKNIIAKGDSLVKEGHLEAVRALLSDVLSKKCPREYRAPLATLARRAGAPQVAIRLLNPIVRASARSHTVPTLEEKVQYAASLTSVGATEESLQILTSVKASERRPDVLFFQAMALIAQWNYADVIPLLREYVVSESLSHYQRLVGKSNLAAALTHEKQTAEAGHLLDDLLRESEIGNQKLLRTNTIKLLAENALVAKDWNLAERYLSQAEELMPSSPSSLGLFIRKWRAALSLSRSGGNDTAIQEMLAVRREAMERRHYETMRDCDRLLAIGTRDRTLAAHLYFGTPYPSYRRSLLEEMGEKEPPREYVWGVGQERSQKPAILDLYSAELDGDKRNLKIGQAKHRLLIQLCSDFYRPFPIASLHFALYPGEFYNPVVAAARIHEALTRIRGWFEKHNLPLSVEMRGGQAKLVGNGLIAIRITEGPQTKDRIQLILSRLQKVWSAASFSSQEARQVLDVSPPTIARILTAGVERGVLIRLGKGKGPGTRYHFPSTADADLNKKAA